MIRDGPLVFERGGVRGKLGTLKKIKKLKQVLSAIQAVFDAILA